MPEYTCECCNFKTLIKTKFAEHCETTKHKRNIENPVEISLSEQVAVLKNKVVSLELMNKQQSIQMGEFEQQMKDMNLKMELFSMLMIKSVQVQPAVQSVQVQPVPVQTAVKKRERYNEEYLNTNYTTTIDEFLEQVNFDEEEVGDLFETSGAVEDVREIVDKLVLKKLKETVDSTDICDRGFVTTDLDRKKMWIKKTKWEVNKEATFVIKNKLRNKIFNMAGDMVYDEQHSSERDIDTYVAMGLLLSNNKWENIDTKIMQMFVVDS